MVLSCGRRSGRSSIQKFAASRSLARNFISEFNSRDWLTPHVLCSLRSDYIDKIIQGSLSAKKSFMHESDRALPYWRANLILHFSTAKNYQKRIRSQQKIPPTSAIAKVRISVPIFERLLLLLPLIIFPPKINLSFNYACKSPHIASPVLSDRLNEGIGWQAPLHALESRQCSIPIPARLVETVLRVGNSHIRAL